MLSRGLQHLRCAKRSQKAVQQQVQKFRASSTNIPDPDHITDRQCTVPTGIMGQPTCHSHPHLVSPGHLVGGLTQQEFTARRADLMRRLVIDKKKESDRGHTVFIPSSPKQYMTDKIPRIFRQNSDFYYLTGCLENDAMLMMTSLPGSEQIHRSVLFLKGKDAHSELWDGPRTSVEDGPQMFRVDDSIPLSEMEHYLKGHATAHPNHFYWYFNGQPQNDGIHDTIRKVFISQKLKFNNLSPRLHIAVQRLLKSSTEVQLAAEACRIGSKIINKAMACTKPGISEHDLHAAIEYWCRREGAEHLAFPPVIAGGNRATAIHYIHDNQILSDGELVLMDAGCQKSMYNSDITRTWPVSGKFTPAQAVLYDIIYDVQAQLMSLLSYEKLSLDQLFNSMVKTLGEYLRREGIIDKSATKSQMLAAAYKFCPHHVSHYLGLDVHDTPAIPRNIYVEPGMLITVEPGIYINQNDTSVPEEFRGIGVRIEDDVLITSNGPVVLTESCIKERHLIEKLVGTKDLPE